MSREAPAVQGISFFDLDHTLLSINSSLKFGLFLYRRSLVSGLLMGRLLLAYLLHLCGIVSISALHKQAGKLFFVGRPIALCRTLATQFFDTCWDKVQNVEGVACLRAAQRRGDYIILLSSSPDFLVEEAALRLEVDQWKATRYDTEGGQVICRVSEIVEGHNKAAFVREILKVLGVDRKNTFGYTDSHHDILFLEAVGTPIAVNPTRQLARECQKRGWAKTPP